MRLSFFLCLVSVLQVSAATSYAQKISLNKSNASLAATLKEIHKQSGFSVLYNAKMLKKAVPVNVNLQNVDIEDALKECFLNQPFSYVINNNTIVVTPKIEESKPVQAPVTITGIVKDNKGIPLPGVSIRVKGTDVGTQSQVDGTYKITVNDNSAVLVFSFIGFVNQEITVGSQTTINVTLTEQTSKLNEVVVVGYGTQKKVNLTGAVSTVSGDELNKRPVTNVTSMLEGTMPGVQINTGGGEPGNENVTIRIRGIGSYSGASLEPLVLIDGVQGNLNDVNPTDIDNVSVLKDAASASIYGSRGANGVLLVTTKQGKAGKMVVQYDGNVGIYKPTNMYKLVTNSATYMDLFNEAHINSGITDPKSLYPQDQIDLYRNATDRVRYPNTDWLSLIFQTAPTQNHNLTFSGGNDKTVYNVSLGYVNQNGIMKGFNYQKYTGRVNLTSKVNDHIKFGTNIMLKSGSKDAVAGNPSSLSQWDGSSMDLFLSAMSQAPTYGPYLADGSGRYTYKAYDFEYNNKNPIAELDKNFKRITNDYEANAQGWLEVQFNKDFSWYTKGAVSYSMSKYRDYKFTIDEYNFQTNQLQTTLDLGQGLTDEDDQTVYTNLYSYLNYAHSFGGHNIKAQVGYSLEQSKFEYLRGYRKNFTDTNLTQLDAGGADIQSANGSENQWAIMSYFGRLNYNYKERYLLEGNVRYDGSSKFSGDNKWSVFPSFSAGWRATEEPFIKALNLNWLTNLKIRGSWGQVGNQNIPTGNYPYQATLGLTGNYSFDNSTLTNGVAQQSLNNPIIKWETTTITDAGLDVTLFRNLTLTADWYKKRTTDIIRKAQVTALVGLTPPVINDGIVDNTGYEIGLNYSNVIRDGALSGFTYSVGANADHFTNKIISIGQRDLEGYYVSENGQPINAFYTLQVLGIFQTAQEVVNSPKQYGDNTLPGDLKYKDVDGNGVINDNDRTLISGVYPKLSYSFNLAASFKGFDLSAMAQGVAGVKSYVTGWGVIPFVQGTPPTTDWLNRWTPEHPSTTMPRIYWGQGAPDKISRASSFFLQDASYLRLKNLVFGYTLPSATTKKIGLERVRVYFSGDNLFTATNFKGLDPERYGNGDGVQYPQNKIYSFGLNVSF